MEMRGETEKAKALAAQSEEHFEEEKFELIQDEMCVHNSSDSMVYVTAAANEAFDWTV